MATRTSGGIIMKNDTRVIYKYVIPEGGKTVIRGWFTRVLDAAE